VRFCINTSITQSLHFTCLKTQLYSFIGTGESVHFEYGKNYKYTYDTKILFNEDSAQKESRAQQDVGLRIRLEFDFTPIFQGHDSQLIRLQVRMN